MSTTADQPATRTKTVKADLRETLSKAAEAGTPGARSKAVPLEGLRIPIHSPGSVEVLKLVLDRVQGALAEIPPTASAAPTAGPAPGEAADEDVFEGSDLLEAIDVYAELLQGVIVERDGYLEALTAAQATRIGLTPVQMENVNCAIDQVNAVAGALRPIGLPIGIRRADAMPYLAVSVAYPAPAAAAGVIALIARLLKYLWDAWNIWRRGKKHARKIRQAIKLYKGEMISGATLAAILAQRLARLTALAAELAAAIAAAKELVKTLRDSGETERADEMEERVDELEDSLEDLQAEIAELQGEIAAVGSGAGAGN